MKRTEEEKKLSNLNSQFNFHLHFASKRRMMRERESKHLGGENLL